MEKSIFIGRKWAHSICWWGTLTWLMSHLKRKKRENRWKPSPPCGNAPIQVHFHNIKVSPQQQCGCSSDIKKSQRNEIKCGSLAVGGWGRPSSAHSERGGVSQGRKPEVPRDKVLLPLVGWTHNGGAATGGCGTEGWGVKGSSFYLIDPLHVCRLKH